MISPIESLDPAAVCAALEPFVSEERRARIEGVLAARLCGLTVLLENLHDPHNGAAALRSCEGAGLTTVHVAQGAAPFRFSDKVTQGCERWLEIRRHADTAAAVRALREAGFELAAAVPGVTTTLDDLDPKARIALVLGNEHAGLTTEAQQAATLRYALPMAGFSQSLNLSVATALSVFRAAERRRRALGTEGDCDANRLAPMRARWYFEDVRGADAILRRAGLLPLP